MTAAENRATRLETKVVGSFLEALKFWNIPGAVIQRFWKAFLWSQERRHLNSESFPLALQLELTWLSAAQRAELELLELRDRKKTQSDCVVHHLLIFICQVLGGATFFLVLLFLASGARRLVEVIHAGGAVEDVLHLFVSTWVVGDLVAFAAIIIERSVQLLRNIGNHLLADNDTSPD